MKHGRTGTLGTAYPPKLLVSARRVAQELDVPIWKANEICWCLDRRFHTPGQAHYRVSRASLDAFKELLDQGLTIAAARAVMWQYKEQGELPPADLDCDQWIRSTGGLVSGDAGSADLRQSGSTKEHRLRYDRGPFATRGSPWGDED